MSGRKATFISETQMPILTKDGDGEINTEWKNVGISLEMLPVVLDDGTIHITVTPALLPSWENNGWEKYLLL